MQARREIIWKESKGYNKLSKKEKMARLDSVVAVTGYNRDLFLRLLSIQDKSTYAKSGSSGRSYRLVADARKAKKRPRRKKKYDEEVLEILKKIWVIMDFPCGKRLAPCMSWLVPKLEAFGEIEIGSYEVRKKLLSISAASIDRLLKGEKRKLSLKKRKSTKPGSLLKDQISVRTFADWDDAKVGFMEMDLVSHEGGNPSGEYAFTLTLTDVCSGWTQKLRL
jgi:hypothetical protein